MSDTTTTRSDIGRRPPRLIFLALACLLVAANGGIALIAIVEQHRAGERAGRSMEAMLALQHLEDLVEDSAADQRLYRVYGDPRRLEAYRTGQEELPSSISRLRGLIAGEAPVLERVVSLVEQDSAALAAALTPIRRDPGSAGEPRELTIGKERTEAIVVMIGDLYDNEQRLTHRQQAIVDSRDLVTIAIVTLGTVGGAGLIAGIFILLRRDARHSEQLFRRIFEVSPFGIVLAEPDDQRIVQANPAFSRMLGNGAEQIVGRTIPDLVHIDDRGLLRDAIGRGSSTDQGIEARYVTRSGTIAWAHVRLAQLNRPDRRSGLLLALTEDITREKRVEAELRQAQKMEAIGQLTGGIAHDFNNLLGIIIGNAEFVIDTARDEDQANFAREILNSALSGADLTRRLLAFARRQSLQPRRIDLNAYLPSHIAILQRLLGESIAITTVLADDLWSTRADPSQVGDALLNLAINARDAMPHGGTIWIATGNVHLDASELDEDVRPGDYVTLSVTDSGTGMMPDVLERAVEPFFSTKAPRAGSGLGLSMIFGFAKQSGGHLRIDSQVGLGTTVHLYLPRAHGVETYEADTPTDAPLLQGSESILLVDDNQEMRTVARRHLVSLGYRVCEAGSGPAALESLLAGNNFDLLLTDVVMPDGMTGYQLAAAARQFRPALKILYTTGYFRSDPADEAGDTASVAMIRKPYRRQELSASVRAVLDG
jgi:PAS domain S-box-containing protein